MKLFPVVCVGLLLVGCRGGTGPAPPSPSSAIQRLVKPHQPLVIAHRGGRTDAPEETLETLRQSVALGADVLELDLHQTADGVVVCMHDATVDRTTDSVGPVAALDWDALQQLDAGARFSPDGGQTFPFAGQGVRVPSLSAVLQAIPDRPFILEIKQSEPAIVDAVLEVLRDENALERVILAAFSAETLVRVREAEPGVATSLAVSEVAAWMWASPGEEAAPGRFLHLPPTVGPLDLVDADLLKRAESEGLGVHVWTISDEAEMRRLVNLGVHGVMTPDPALLRAVVDGT